MLNIKIGGELRPFKFGFNAMDIFCKEKSIGIGDFGAYFNNIASNKATIADLRDIVFAGLCGGALSMGSKVDFTTYQVGDWMDELKSDELAKIMASISGAVFVKKKEKVIGRKP